MGFFDNYKDKNVAAVEVATQDTEALEGAEATKEEEKVVEMPKKKPFAIWNVKGEDYKMVLGTHEHHGSRKCRNARFVGDAGCGSCSSEEIPPRDFKGCCYGHV